MSASSCFDALDRALDAAGSRIDLFVRDDDGGWDDPRLLALLDRFAAAGAPIDVAVIPNELSDSLATTLRARLRGGSSALGCHQHGWAHVNHQVEGRKCEFGPQRSAGEQTTDLALGATRLREALHGLADPIFTPPWNRCTADTTRALAGLGVKVLSRDAGAQPIDLHGLAELPVAVDWCKRVDGERASLDEQARRIVAALAQHETVGIMLHHPVMNDDELDALDLLLRRLGRHPACRLQRMRDAAVAPLRPAALA